MITQIAAPHRDRAPPEIAAPLERSPRRFEIGRRYVTMGCAA
jgi:hypothetical protein